MKRYAFIDVQNTENTTRKLLGFEIDWGRLVQYLRDKWKCEMIFLYSGVEEGNNELINEFGSLDKLSHCTMRTKSVYAYKRPDKKISIKCVSCGKENIEIIDTGYARKSNCDVDLTVDAMEVDLIDIDSWKFKIKKGL